MECLHFAEQYFGATNKGLEMVTSKETKKFAKCGEEIQTTHKPETTSQCDFSLCHMGKLK